jgi:O-antigen/teichoic acid export membrane protein
LLEIAIKLKNRVENILNSNLVKNIIIFILGTVVNKGMNFFILPVLTYYLTKEDYGMIGIITSVVTIASIYIGFFPSNFIMVKFSKFGKEQMSKYISNIIIIMVMTFLIVLTILYGTHEYIFSSYGEGGYLVIYITFLCLFQVFWQMLSTIVQIEKDALKYTILQFLHTIATIGLTLLLIVKFSWGWKGKFFAELTIFFIASVYALYYLYKSGYIKIDYDAKKLYELFHFLFPLTFYVVGLFIMGTIDKIFLANLIGLDAAGIYAIAITMTIIINIVFDAVLKAWEPYLFELLNSGSFSDKIKVVKVTYLFSLFVIISVIIYIFFVPYLFGFMIDEKFNEALLYIPVLVIAYGFEGLRKPVTELLNHINRVKTVGTITFFAALLNIGLNIFMIKAYGIAGAAYATTISFALLYIATMFFVFKYCNLPWLLRR